MNDNIKNAYLTTESSPETVEHYIFEHKVGEDCHSSIYGGRAIKAENTTKDRTFDCTEPDCENDLVYQRTETVKRTLPEVHDSRKQYIKDLSDYERALLLGMTMESIRGSWSQPEDRLGIIGLIHSLGIDNDILSEEFMDAVKDRAETLYIRKATTHKYADGRYFRGKASGCYGKLWDEVETDIETMKELAGCIPNDMTWSEFKFEKIVEEKED